MSINIERVQAALRTAVDSPQTPTQAQILEIARMTHVEDARKEIQRRIYRRLEHADKYSPYEIHHTLILVQKCLLNASSNFVDFCMHNVNLVHALTNFKYDGASSNREKARLVCDRAKTVSGILVNPNRLAEKRRILSAETASTIAPPPPYRMHVPLPTPPSSPEKLGKSSLDPSHTGSWLPTPDPSPDAFSRLGLDVKSNSTFSDPKTIRSDDDRAVHTTSIFDMKHSDVASLTFKRGELDKVLRILDFQLKVHPSSRNDSEELVEALTLVHHCLYWGSADFVTHCQVIKTTFQALRQHNLGRVRSRADAVVHLLQDTSRLQQERRFRMKLIPQTVNPSITPLSESSTESPPGTLEKSHTGNIVVLEPVVDISRSVTKLGSRPVTGGGYSDVWKGEYSTIFGKEIVAIKFLRRLRKIPLERLQKRLNRELHIWRKVVHENIAPFYGIIIDDGDVGMISPYYDKEGVVEYIRGNRDVDPLKMLQGIARGVEHLHANKFVHGDIKGANVMISNSGTPKLIDFGLSQVIDEFAEATGYTTSNIASSLRWSAPELLISHSDVSSKTEKSDIYAFASTCIEVMTLRSPYHGNKDPYVLNHVLKGGIPERPSMEERWSPCDDLWEFLTTCWRNLPQDRPNIVLVKHKLAEFYNGSIEPHRRVHFS